MKPPRIIERKLGRERALGQACQALNEIEIDPRQPPKEYLDTLLHEALHLLDPNAPEEVIQELAGGLTHVLWSKGFRQVRLK